MPSRKKAQGSTKKIKKKKRRQDPVKAAPKPIRDKTSEPKMLAGSNVTQTRSRRERASKKEDPVSK